MVTIPSQDLCNYHVYFDNFFTSPDLLVHLKKIGLSATGTVRQNRIKHKLEMPKKSDRGQCLVAHDKNSKLNYITVMDPKPVSVLSTGFNDEPKVPIQRWHEHAKKTILFHQAFSRYNNNMGGVDLHDQHCNSVLPTIRSKKWTWCLFIRLIQASIANATVIYNKLHPEEKKGTKDVVQEICEYYRDSFDESRSRKRRCTTLAMTETSEITHNLKLGLLKRCSKSNCKVRTQKYCENCEKYLCSEHWKEHLSKSN